MIHFILEDKLLLFELLFLQLLLVRQIILGLKFGQPIFQLSMLLEGFPKFLVLFKQPLFDFLFVHLIGPPGGKNITMPLLFQFPLLARSALIFLVDFENEAHYTKARVNSKPFKRRRGSSVGRARD